MVMRMLFLVTLCLSALSERAAADMAFTGTLLDMPCQLDPASAGQDVVFLQSALPQFHHAPGRGVSRGFAIRLLNCRPASIGKVVRLVFSGEPEPGVPGALKVAGGNTGRLAIQMIDTDGQTPLALGEAHRGGKGEMIRAEVLTLNFSAYVQATPEALAARSVTAGEYSAIATFEVSYQ